MIVAHGHFNRVLIARWIKFQLCLGKNFLLKFKTTLNETLAQVHISMSSSCPLCESVVAGLDKPFVEEGEVDTSWAL